MKSLPALFLLLITCATVLAEGLPNEKEFQASLTQALKDQNREAFYKLVCFDGADKNWMKSNKQVFEVLFQEAKKYPNFTGSISAGKARILQPLSTQRFNLPLVAAYLMHISQGETVNLPLGLKDGELKVVCTILRAEDSNH